MADATLELLRELTEAPGISGYEQEVREIIRIMGWGPFKRR